MPKRYVAEMFCDRVAACRIYLRDKYTDASAYDYFMRARKWTMMHPETASELEKMLRILKDEGEEAAFSYVKAWLKEKKKRGFHGYKQRKKADDSFSGSRSMHFYCLCYFCA